MSFKRSRAIVLKNHFPKKQSLALLDEHLGKVAGVTHAMAQIAPGAFISYATDGRRTQHLLMQQVELEDLPLFIAQEDILFLHHILELCYYFIPDGSSALPVFTLLQMVYASGDWMQSPTFKKIFLCKLFALLGVYPSEESMQNTFYIRLVSMPFELVITQDFYPEDEQQIDSWLRMCIASHPGAHKFKTVHFLDAHRNV